MRETSGSDADGGAIRNRQHCCCRVSASSPAAATAAVGVFGGSRFIRGEDFAGSSAAGKTMTMTKKRNHCGSDDGVAVCGVHCTHCCRQRKSMDDRQLSTIGVASPTSLGEVDEEETLVSHSSVEEQCFDRLGSEDNHYCCDGISATRHAGNSAFISDGSRNCE